MSVMLVEETATVCCHASRSQNSILSIQLENVMQPPKSIGIVDGDEHKCIYPQYRNKSTFFFFLLIFT